MRTLRYTLVIISCIAFITLSNCDEGDSEQSKELSGTWKASSIIKDGVAITSLDGLEITFHTGGRYTSINGTTTDTDVKVFLGEGTWSLVDESSGQFLRDDIETNVKRPTPSSLTMAFTLSDDDARRINGRIGSVTGEYEVEMVQK